jgi:hypothetical protein
MRSTFVETLMQVTSGGATVLSLAAETGIRSVRKIPRERAEESLVLKSLPNIRIGYWGDGDIPSRSAVKYRAPAGLEPTPLGIRELKASTGDD